MFSEEVRRKSLLFLYILSFISIMFVILSIYTIINDRQIRQNNILNNQDSLISSSANLISQKSQNIQNIVNKIASDITNHKFVVSDIERLQLYKDKSILGIGIVYVPDYPMPHQNIYWQNNGSLMESSLYDYDYSVNIEQNQWYNNVIRDNKNWSRPYYDGASKEFMVSYSVPFFDEQHQKIGVVALDIDLTAIDEFVASNLGSQYVTIVNSNGDYIYKYEKKYSLLGLNVQNNQSSLENKLFLSLGQNCSQQCVRHVDNNGTDLTFLIYKLSNVPWIILAEYTPDYLKSLDRPVNHAPYITLVICSYLLFISLTWIFITKISFRKSTKKFLWTGSIITSVLLVLCISSIWLVSSNLYYVNTSDAITDVQTLNVNLKNVESEASLKKISPLVQIPTSIVINSAKFLDSYEVNLHGNIMQRYSIGESELVGVRLNDSSNGNVKLINIKHTPTYDIATWAFDINIRHSIDYSRYPFTHGNIWLSIAPSSNKENIVLVPDFTFYSGLHDINKANGINPQVVIPNWNISGTYFSFMSDVIEMSDAVNNYRALELPALRFNILVNSNLANGIITTMVPFIVILVILFITLLTISRKPNDHIRFDVPRLISATTGMFFTLIFAHATLRNKVLADLMYIEYIYLVFYLAILLLIANAFYFARRTNKFIMYGDNLFVKIAAIPSLLLVVLVITAIFFI